MGGSPKNIPALYTLLAHIDMNLGVYYPMGGFGELVKAYETIAKEQGALIRYSSPVKKIISQSGRVTAVGLETETLACDAVVAAADYRFVETKLLASQDRSYSDAYWRSRVLSPSALLIHIGLNKRLERLIHHNLFFDTDWAGHFDDVFREKSWSNSPLFYASVTSRSDPTVSPKGAENIFILAPQPAGIKPSKSQQELTYKNIIERLEKFCGESIKDHIVVKQLRTATYFESSFNAFEGNAFGPAHTLSQSAIFRPRMKSRKLGNLYYAGQYTNPGTGVPMVTLSGKIVAQLLSAEQ